MRWKDLDDKPTLPLNDARTIFRDVVLGLEYRKPILMPALVSNAHNHFL